MRRFTTLVLSLLLPACVVDPRPECAFQIVVEDEVTGAVDLEESDFACRPSEIFPSSLMYEAIFSNGEIVTNGDPSMLCDQEGLRTALEVDGIEADAYGFVPWTEDDGGRTVVYEDPELVVEDGWYLVSYLRENPGGGYVVQEPWSAFFQYGVEGSALDRSICH